jgi:hypothetical protein
VEKVALKAMVERATALPWEGVSGDDYKIIAAAYPTTYRHRFPSDDTGSALAEFGNRPSDFGEANRDLVVAAVNALPALLASVEQLRAERDEARAAWKDATEGWDLAVQQSKSARDEWRSAEASLSAATARIRALEHEAGFLCDRLSSLEWMDDGYAEVQRDFFGHVEPSLARLRSLLAEMGEGA